MARDRISALDDNLLCAHILSKVSLKDAIRCSVLSRRWRCLWTLLPHLIFSSTEFTTKEIDNIMFHHSAQLESLEISASFSNEINDDTMLWKWINCASLKRVKQFTLEMDIECFPVNVPTSVFSCDCLTFFKLQRFRLIQLPPFFSGFRYLITCCLSFVTIPDVTVEQLVVQCPLLENLTVQYCRGLGNLKISAVNLKYLNLTENVHPRSLTVTCPQLVNFIVHLLVVPLSIKLNSCGDLHFHTNDITVLEGLSTTGLLKKITLSEVTTHVISLTALGRFSCLEQLSIESINKVADLEVANLFLLPDNLKVVYVEVSSFNEEEIALIGCLLRSAPSLRTMALTLPVCPQYVHKESFLKRLLSLKRSSRKASVIITEKHCWHCAECFSDGEDVFQ